MQNTLSQSPHLSPAQQDVFTYQLLESGFNCVLQMPTGSGKTWLAEQAIQVELAQGRRAIYLTPLRALAAELLHRWQNQFGTSQVGIFTGDYGSGGKSYPVSFGQARLLIMTPERLDACTRAWRAHWPWIPEVNLVIVDEMHLLGDSSRGARLEGTLSRMQRLNPFLRILGLSATLGNREELADWLGGVEYASSWRPVPLSWRVARYCKADEKLPLLADETSRLIRAGGKSLVFVQSRRRAEQLSMFLCEQGLRAQHHHAGLNHEARREVEARFRGQGCDLLVATATLEMGMNLPARQVILYDLQGFDGSDFRPLSTNTVWQRAGRAGRPGLDTDGEVVLFAPQWDRQAEQYAHGNFEAIRSGLSDRRALAEQIVTEVASGLARTRTQLTNVFRHSLAAHQCQLPEVEQVVEEMREAGMLQDALSANASEHATRHLKATRLGHIAVRHFLTPATVLLFRRVLDQHRDLTFLDLLLVACASEDCEPILPVDFEELDELVEHLDGERSCLLALQASELTALLGVQDKRLLATVKMALLLRGWTRLADEETLAARHDCYPFEVTRLRDAVVRLLQAMGAVIAPEEEDTEDPAAQAYASRRERIQVLGQMVSAGLDEQAVTLTVVEGIGPTLARRLHAEGVRDIEELALVDPSAIAGVRGISPARAERWIARASERLSTHSALRYRDEGPIVNLTPAGWPSDIDPYRLRRALDLQVFGPDGNRYQVTGGLDPHLVRLQAGSFHCDCADAAKGHLCKHVMVVRLRRGDRHLMALTEQLSRTPSSDRLDLFDLWFGRSPHTGLRSA
jgi:helicase